MKRFTLSHCTCALLAGGLLLGATHSVSASDELESIRTQNSGTQEDPGDGGNTGGDPGQDPGQDPGLDPGTDPGQDPGTDTTN